MSGVLNMLQMEISWIILEALSYVTNVVFVCDWNASFEREKYFLVME